MKPGLLAHANTPYYSGDGDQEDHDLKLGQVNSTSSQPIKSWAQWCAPVIPDTWKA
jgi:hypothetical protein